MKCPCQKLNMSFLVPGISKITFLDWKKISAGVDLTMKEYKY